MVILQFNEETLKKNFLVLIKILKDLKLSVRKTSKKQAENEKSIKELQEENKSLKENVHQLQEQTTILKEEVKETK